MMGSYLTLQGIRVNPLAPEFTEGPQDTRQPTPRIQPHEYRRFLSILGRDESFQPATELMDNFCRQPGAQQGWWAGMQIEKRVELWSWTGGQAKMGRDTHGFKPRYADIKDSGVEQRYLPSGSISACQGKWHPCTLFVCWFVPCFWSCSDKANLFDNMVANISVNVSTTKSSRSFLNPAWSVP